MAQTNSKKNTIKTSLPKRIFRGLRDVFYNSLRLFLIVSMGSFLLLQFPIVQTFLGHRLTTFLSDKTDFNIQVERVHIDWYDVVKLKNVSVTDPNSVRLIEAPYIEIDYELENLYNPKEIHFDQVTINSAVLNLHKDDELNIDLFVRNINERIRGRKRVRKGKLEEVGEIEQKEQLTAFTVSRVILENLSLTYHVEGRPRETEPIFDRNHIEIQKINAFARNFKIIADTVSCKINNLQCIETNSQLQLKRLRTHFQYNKRAISFHKLHAMIGESILRDSLVLSYEKPSDLSDFIEKVQLDANLKDTRISTQDLKKFTTKLSSFNDTYLLNGTAQGTVNDFTVDEVRLKFGRNSYAHGKVAFVGLPKLDKTLMQFDFRNSFLNTPDIKQYISSFEYDILSRFGNIMYKASFNGYLNDFSTQGEFETEIGNLQADVNIQPKKNAYKGKLSTQNFNLGVLSDYPELVQTVSFDGTIEGTGFLLETADFVLDAQIHSLELLGYNYQNITIDSTHLRKRLFEGEMIVNDPNLKMTVSGDINFQDSSFNFINVIDTARLFDLGFSPQPIDLSTTLKANFSGLTPADIAGDIKIENQQLFHDGNSFQLDSLQISTGFTESSSGRFLTVHSEMLSLNASGIFNVEELTNSALRLFNEYELDYFNNDSLFNSYYAQAIQVPYPNQKITFNAELNEVNKLIRLFTDDLKISNHTKINGEFSSGDAARLKVKVIADTLAYTDKYIAKGLNAELFTQKRYDSLHFTGSATIYSSAQNIAGINTENLKIDMLKYADIYTLNNTIEHRDSDDFFHAAGDLTLSKNGISLNLQETDFLILNDEWISSGDNLIVVTDSTLDFKNLKFLSGEQVIHAKGAISQNPNDSLEIDVKNFDLGFMSNYLEGEVKGIAHLDFFLKDLYGERILDFDFAIDSIHLNNFSVGSLNSVGEWQQEQERLDLEAFILRDNAKIIEVEGGYSPLDSIQNFDLLVTLNGATLQMIQPFIEENVSDLQGRLQGKINIGGTIPQPSLSGFANISNGALTLNYLGTTYRFEDPLIFENGKIEVRDFVLTDENNKKATLNGGLSYASLTNMKVDLRGEMQEFMVLNTKEEDNELFYGEAYGSGDFALKGTLNSIELDVNAKSEANTRISIPILESESVQEQNYITFVKEDKDTTNTNNIAQENRIRMNLNVEITPDAYCEIIFDKKSGDIIRGTGEGKIKMLIDTKGEFSMFGDVEIVEGAYNFTMLNVIDKRFDVLPNSRISWSGNPYEADLDVTASYTQTASLAPIIQADSSILNQPEIRRRYPVDVLLGMKGNLLQPEISFDIDVRDYPATLLVNGVPLSLEGYVAGFEQRILSDEQELNRQVFSLILLKKLSPEQTFSGISQTAGSSVSELLTNQLSYWVSQVDENLEIDLNLDGLNADALNTFQLRLSYSFMDGRLRITRDGTFTNVKNEADVSSVVGDWTVEYLLSPDGKLRAKMYHKHNVNTFNTGLENNSTAGVSVLHTKSFNSLADIFKSKKKKRKRKEKKEKALESDKAMLEQKRKTKKLEDNQTRKDSRK